MNALEKAIHIAGDATKLAEKLDVSSMTISHWKHRHGGSRSSVSGFPNLPGNRRYSA